MNTGEKGIALIKHFEGFRSDSYKDQAGIPTIGYGTITYPNGEPVRMGETVSEEKALEYLYNDVRHTEREVNAILKVNLTQCQFDSLVSFAYNVGCYGLKSSSLLKCINSHNTDQDITELFTRWNKVTVNGVKQESKGLTNRRKSEAWLFLHDEIKLWQ